jgi:hypothetical protein
MVFLFLKLTILERKNRTIDASTLSQIVDPTSILKALKMVFKKFQGNVVHRPKSSAGP